MIDILQRVGGISDAAAFVLPIVPADIQYNYRNKMEFSFSPLSRGSSRGQHEGSAGFVLGLHRPGSHRDVVQITECSLQSQTANELLETTENACRKAGLEAYDQDAIDDGRSPLPATTAILQHVVIRHSVAADQYLVNLVTSVRSARSEHALSSVAAALMQHPKVVGIVNSISAKGRPLEERRIERETVLRGTGRLVEHACGLVFEFGANSFFQTNTKQAEKLFALVQEAAGVGPDDVVCDLFCGAGAILLLLARRCREAWGIEINKGAIDDALRNAVRNKISNASFICGDVEKLLAGHKRNALDASMHIEVGRDKVSMPDVVVVDPARPGLEDASIRFLKECGARRLVYVSCNPASQARDIRALCSHDRHEDAAECGMPFSLVSVRPVDLYPHTPHVETVAVLERNVRKS